MSHPNVEVLDRMVLLLSNQQGDVRRFIEVPRGSTITPIAAELAVKRLDVGWFDQAWFTIHKSFSKENGAAYELRNVRSGTYLQVGKQLADGTTGLEMNEKVAGPGGKAQTWYITSDEGFARIKNAKTGQVFQLLEPSDVSAPRVVLATNDPTNKETQTWKYERVSRSAQDVEAAMKASRHMPNEAIEYQKLDATYVSLPPNVRKEIWKNTGLGSNSLVWREQIFDCDDFAFAAKAAVSRWAAENLRCDGFTILFGITFGKRGSGKQAESHAYNWYLDWDELKNVVFFEPSTGDESDDGWNYSGFNGIF